MKKSGSIIRGAALLALSAALPVAGMLPAYAETQAAAVVVRFSDLDLSRQSGAAELYARISRAATRACQPFDSRSSYEQQRMQACVKSAIARAVDQADKPLLYSMHESRDRARRRSSRSTHGEQPDRAQRDHHDAGDA